jgi:hypothetical protein
LLAEEMKKRHPFIPDRPHIHSDYREAKTRWSQRLLNPDKRITLRTPRAVSPVPHFNVVGVGIAEKVSEGKLTGDISVTFYVRKKFPDSHVLRKDRLPKSIYGLTTDIEEVGVFRPLAETVPDPKTKVRPARPGCSIGFKLPGSALKMAGTFGALVQDSNGVYILSNNHVLANRNLLPPGSPIFEPGLRDGGQPDTDQIASLSRFVPFKEGGAFNSVDCALAMIAADNLVSNSILKIGPPKGKGMAQLPMEVHKFGRSTQYTVGRVVSVDADVTVKSYNFRKQIMIQGLTDKVFAEDGDSGALVLERGSQKAVGLLFGAGINSDGTVHALANHIDDVLKALNVTLVL